MTALQTNLQKLIKLGNYQIADLERKAGVRKNSIYNIIKGNSKRPSAELLQAIAEVSNVNVQDLLKNSIKGTSNLSNSELKLLADVAVKVIEELISSNANINTINSLGAIQEAFNYSMESNASEADIRFIKWIVKRKLENNEV